MALKKNMLTEPQHFYLLTSGGMAGSTPRGICHRTEQITAEARVPLTTISRHITNISYVALSAAIYKSFENLEIHLTKV